MCSSFPSLSFGIQFENVSSVVLALFPRRGKKKVKGLLEDLAARHSGDMQTHLAFHRHRHLGQGIHGHDELRGKKECKGTTYTHIIYIYTCIYI